MMPSELTSKGEDTQQQPRDRAFTGAFALIVTAVACSIVLLLAPRPLEPYELPALRLDSAQVAAQLEGDRALAAQVAKGPDIDAWLALYLAEGLSELEGNRDIEALSARRAALGMAARNVFERLGPHGTRALLAATTERAMSALRNELPARDAYGLLGRFPALLDQYGFVAADGELLAPELSVRAFYKARFNLICERPREADLSSIELQALEGWNALHALHLAPAQRAHAARAFYLHGGRDSAEALAIWQYQGGAHGEALSLLRRTYERSGALRMRNMALFAGRH